MNRVFILKEPVNQILTANSLFDRIKKINIDYKKENLILICVNTKNKMIHNEVIAIGGLDSCICDPKTIFRIALKHNSASIIIAHNHPSGDIKPSSEDYSVYERLKKAGEIISIKCLDSIIFNKKEYYTIR